MILLVNAGTELRLGSWGGGLTGEEIEGRKLRGGPEGGGWRKELRGELMGELTRGA